ncbi:CPBP family intramembrane glutamic endopeptidase [Streptococcus dentiloxodontae]
MSKKSNVLIFVILAYSLSWMIWLGMRFSGVQLGQPLSQLGSMLAMWMPALAFFILRKMRPADIRLQTKFSITLKGRWYYYLLALWLPALLSLLGSGLYFVVFRNQFSLGFESLQSTLASSGISKGSVPLQLVVLAQFFAAVTYAPFFNSLLALGEEIGWRGYLYPALRKRFSLVQSHILVGLIWSLWHLPINLQGYNYGLTYFAYPWLGVLAMFIFCFSLGVLLSWVVEKTGSIWSSALMHGAVNGSAGLGLLFQLPSEKAEAMRILGPSLAGLLAGVPLLIFALAILQKERKATRELR